MKKKDTKDLNTSQVLSHDILEQEIFSRLPVKSLLRFKSISKQWRSTIESTFLAKKRLLVRFPNPRLLVLRSELSSDRSSRTLFLETISKDDDHDHSKIVIHSYIDDDGKFPGHFVHYLGRIMGYCNGLVCIQDLGYIYIVNPTTRNLQILSPHSLQAYSSRPGWSGELPIDVGFGRDIVTGRYKVILIYKFDRFLVKAEVFDLTNNVRRYIFFPISRNQLIEDKTSVFANGSLFWLTKRDSISTDKLTKLAAIDLHTEKFRDVLLPSWYTEYSVSVYLWSFKDRVCLSDVLQYPNVDVWSLEQEDPSVKWEKIFSISITSMDCLDPCFWKLGLAACYCRPMGEKPSKDLLKDVPEDHCSSVLFTENLISLV